VAVLVAAPFVVGDYRLGLLTDILIYGLLVVSLDLLIGYTGLVSLGHAAFFGLGAYAVGVLAERDVSSSLVVVLPVAVLVAGLVALVLGWFATATRGVAFIMLTLAFGQLLFVLAVSWRSLTNGDDGLAGIRDATLVPGSDLEPFPDDLAFYFYALAVFLAGYLVVRTLVRSPFGLALEGIRENPERMTALGYWVRGYKLAAFTAAGALAGLAGALHAQKLQFVSPEDLGFTLSALVLVMHTIGGARSLWGPVVGAGLVLLVRDELSAAFDRWQLLLGVVFILFVYLLPQGIAGLFAGRGRVRLPGRRAVSRSLPQEASESAPPAGALTRR
jgi:branched-chain amino acid transport system permease protein